MSKLKPCPFCGGGFDIALYYDTEEQITIDQYAIYHDPDLFPNCPIAQYEKLGDFLFDTVEEAIKVCNMRYEPPTPGGAIVPAGNNRLRKPLKKCLQCNTVIEYNDIRLDDMGYSCCPHCQSNRLKTIYEVIDG